MEIHAPYYEISANEGMYIQRGYLCLLHYKTVFPYYNNMMVSSGMEQLKDHPDIEWEIYRRSPRTLET